MKVTLAKALSIKNRLIGDINKLKEKIQKSNSITFYVKTLENIPEPKFPNNMAALLNEFSTLQNKFIVLKTAISLANKDIAQQTRIFALSKLKSFLTIFVTISCHNSETYDGGRYGNGETYTITRVQISEEEKEKIIKDIQNEIDRIQEEIERFNWRTEIEIPD